MTVTVQPRSPAPPIRRLSGKYAHLSDDEAIRLILRNLQFRLGAALLAANKGALHRRH